MTALVSPLEKIPVRKYAAAAAAKINIITAISFARISFLSLFIVKYSAFVKGKSLAV